MEEWDWYGQDRVGEGGVEVGQRVDFVLEAEHAHQRSQHAPQELPDDRNQELLAGDLRVQQLHEEHSRVEHRGLAVDQNADREDQQQAQRVPVDRHHAVREHERPDQLRHERDYLMHLLPMHRR